MKTLQAAIMVALFLGELLRLSVRSRLVLLFGGCAWVFACNVLRATALVVIAGRDGLPALARWHDAIGTAVLIAGLGGLVVLGSFLGRDEVSAPLATNGAPSAAPPASLAIAGTVWLVLSFVATELWYRGHEERLIPRPAWEARWPSAGGVREMPIADATRAILRYNAASSAAWEAPPGVFWWSFFARWEPQRAALQLVRSHSPEICLPATGRTFVRELSPVTIDTALLPLRFRVYQFEQGAQALFVFVCIQEDKTTTNRAPAEFSTRSRLLATWRGQRNLGQRLLELALLGAGDFERARALTAETVAAIVQPVSVTR